MAARPVFDFEGSLILARRLVELATRLETEGTDRSRLRDTAMAADSFQGPYGDDHRRRRDAEDSQHELTVESLRSCADQWATAWTTAVERMNNALLSEARLEQGRYNDMQWRSYHYEVAYAEPDAVISTPVIGTVETPELPDTPTGTNYAGGAVFAHYYRSGPDMSILYVSSPPGSATL